MNNIVGTDVKVNSRESTAYCNDCEWKMQWSYQAQSNINAPTSASIHAEQTGHSTHSVTREHLTYTPRKDTG